MVTTTVLSSLAIILLVVCIVLYFRNPKTLIYSLLSAKTRLMSYECSSYGGFIALWTLLMTVLLSGTLFYAAYDYLIVLDHPNSCIIGVDTSIMTVLYFLTFLMIVYCSSP